MYSFTLFGHLVPELRRYIWDAAVENAHEDSQVLHVLMVGIITNTQGQKVADLKHSPNTFTETQDTQHHAQAFHEARHAVRKRLSSTLELGIRRVGIDMTALCRYRAHHQETIQSMRLDRSDPQRGQTAQQRRAFILRDSQALLYLLQWLFPGSGVYTVWDDDDVVDFHTNAEARMGLIKHQQNSNGMVAQSISFIRHRRRWFGLPQIPVFAERFSKVSATLSNLRVGHVVYSSGGNGTNGGSVTEITEMSLPEAIGP